MTPEERLDAAARALYARLGGHPGYGKNRAAEVGWDVLSRAQRRPWLEDARTVLKAYEDAA